MQFFDPYIAAEDSLQAVQNTEMGNRVPAVLGGNQCRTVWTGPSGHTAEAQLPDSSHLGLLPVPGASYASGGQPSDWNSAEDTRSELAAADFEHSPAGKLTAGRRTECSRLATVAVHKHL